MAGMVSKYTAQLVILETTDNGDLVAALEALMKQSGDAVSRADVLRQALAPGLRALRKKHEGPALITAIEKARTDREAREQAAHVRRTAVHA
jgi:hypothetical protein